MADICGLVAGAVFVVAGVAKVAYNDRFATALQLSGVTPSRLVAAGRFALPPVELAIGVLLFAGVEPLGGALAAAALVVFSVSVWPSVRAGADLPCACFGGSESRTDYGLLARNAVLAGYAAVAAVSAGGARDVVEAASGSWAEAARLSIVLLTLAFVPFLVARFASAWQSASEIVDQRVVERSRLLAAELRR
jgi:methylamine utilization protein MauE